MAKLIRDIGSKYKRIRDIGQHYPVVGAEVVAAALGAELVGDRPKGGSPVAVFAARHAMARRISSNRPVGGGVRGQAHEEIPIADSEWCKLKELAATLSKDSQAPTAGQVAGALLKLSLASVDLAALRVELQQTATVEPLAT